MSDRVLDPEMEIIDPHHHLYPSNHWAGGTPYLLREFAAEIVESGHRVIATVYVECGTSQLSDGPAHLRPAGEAAFVAETARQAESGQFGPVRVAEGFVGHADLRAGDLLEEAVAALAEASEGRLRAIRCSAAWDADSSLAPGARAFAPQGLMADASFRAGVQRLPEFGLVYDAWQYYPQLSELADLADAAPDTTMACGHCGGLLGNGAYAAPGNFDRWRANVLELAKRPNVVMKLGGLSHDRNGFAYRARDQRPSEDELVADWTPYIDACIEAFGTERCMFESNFPVDSVAASYRTLWNVFKRVAAGCTGDEKAALFSATARRIYRLR